MCTVTFIPVKDTYYITSNRDEKSGRKQALPPKHYTYNNARLVYPKDADAGGTWICMHENGNAAVLLNGAFNKHISTGNYKKSRGIIFLEIISASMPVNTFLQTDLLNIEPFTLVVLDNDKLYECRWDGTNKHSRQLEKNRPHIWSSATLYDKAVVKKREQWFFQWLSKYPSPSQQDILHFHQFTGDGDTNNDLLMNRNNNMLTVSITGIQFNNDKGIMHYLDLKDNSVCSVQLKFSPSYVL